MFSLSNNISIIKMMKLVYMFIFRVVCLFHNVKLFSLRAFAHSAEANGGSEVWRPGCSFAPGKLPGGFGSLREAPEGKGGTVCKFC